ncbi:hypothetical protein J6590_081502 [Homalodisca vitripennis]|nr:hypothetical protein J6590_081502 [Homalodisca vitripennis]
MNGRLILAPWPIEVMSAPRLGTCRVTDTVWPVWHHPWTGDLRGTSLTWHLTLSRGATPLIRHTFIPGVHILGNPQCRGRASPNLAISCFTKEFDFARTRLSLKHCKNTVMVIGGVDKQTTFSPC